MRKDFPAPPTGKRGWPWDGAMPSWPDRMPDGSRWPKLSIVTPSYNQGEFIEETIRSVLMQNYPDLEYIIIDGGSADKTLQIIKNYEDWISYWVSEKDRGQSHAINKGLRRCTGEVAAWINSDDFYAEGVFTDVIRLMCDQGMITKDIIHGNCIQVDTDSRKVRRMEGGAVNRKYLLQVWKKNRIAQPSVFIKKSILDRFTLDENLEYVLDWELWMRMAGEYSFSYFPKVFAYFRVHRRSKTFMEWPFFEKEQKKIVRRLLFKERMGIKFQMRYLLWEMSLLRKRLPLYRPRRKEG